MLSQRKSGTHQNLPFRNVSATQSGGIGLDHQRRGPKTVD